MKQIRTVLCPTDFTPLSELNMALAIGLCQRLDARLVLHHNMAEAPPDFLGVNWMWNEEHQIEEKARPAEVEKKLLELFKKIPSSLDFEAKVSHGPLEQGLLLLANQLPADLIVMGSHGRDDPDHMSLTEQVVLKAPCQVVTAGEKLDAEVLFSSRGPSQATAPASSQVLIAVDLDRPSEASLAAAWALADVMPHELHLLHVLSTRQPTAVSSALAPGTAGTSMDKTTSVRDQQEAKETEEAAKKLQGLVPAEFQARTRVHVASGNPADEILRLASGLDALFILIGGRRASVLRRWLTHPASLDVLHRSDRPVWFVPTTAESAFEPIDGHAQKTESEKTIPN